MVCFHGSTAAEFQGGPHQCCIERIMAEYDPSRSTVVTFWDVTRRIERENPALFSQEDFRRHAYAWSAARILEGDGQMRI